MNKNCVVVVICERAKRVCYYFWSKTTKIFDPLTNKVFSVIVITTEKFRQIETPSNILDGKLAAKNTKPCIHPVCHSTSSSSSISHKLKNAGKSIEFVEFFQGFFRLSRNFQ